MAPPASLTPCRSAGRITANLLFSLFALSPFAATSNAPSSDDRIALLPQIPIGVPESRPESKELDLHLRQIFHYGTHEFPGLARRYDVRPETLVTTEDDSIKVEAGSLTPLRMRAWQTHIFRLADRSLEKVDKILDTARLTGAPLPIPDSDWRFDKLYGPNYTDKETVLSFARMSNDAYKVDPNDPEWEPVGGGFNYTEDFGWENDGLRGHIFADTENSTVVLSLKGTTPAVFDGSGTTTQDKENDNLFFGCCCGQGSIMWHKVCDCQTATYTCNNTCVSQALHEKNRYYYAARELYRNVTELYPTSEIWLTGHSLGGSTMALVGATYGHPVLTFAAPGNAMPAKRLGLPTPPDYHLGSVSGVPWTASEVHFGHTADPIFMGECNGASSVCSIGGYSMESMCHTGLECVYNTRIDLGWYSRAWNHGISTYIHQVIEAYNDTAECVAVSDCTDCYLWKFFESHSSEPGTTSTTTTTESFTQTRTETCKTPGWWGCLDETTSTTTSKTTTTTTSTCHTPGWFGCLDPTTTTEPTISTTKAAPHPTPTLTSPPTATHTSTQSSTTTTSCETPGFFWGCWDVPATSSSSTITHTLTSSHTHKPSATSTCEHPGIFWGCWDPTTIDPPSPSTTKASHESSTSTCRTPGLLWGCWDKPTAAVVLGYVVQSEMMITDPTPSATPLPLPESQFGQSKGECKYVDSYGICWDWLVSNRFVEKILRKLSNMYYRPIICEWPLAPQTSLEE